MIKQRKFVVLGVALAALGGLGAWSRLHGQRSSEFRTVPVGRGNVLSTISATGNLNAVVTVEVGTQVSGNIKQLFADFNTRVQKGQLVARIDPEIFQARVNQAQANLDSARAGVGNAEAGLAKNQADIANARSQLAIAKANVAKEMASLSDMKTKYGRQEQLFNAGLIATQDRDSAQANYDAAVAAVQSAQAQVQSSNDAIRAAEAQREVAQAQLQTAQAQVKQQRAALQQAQIDLQHTYIYAPVDGTVIARKVDVGQTVVASLQAPAIFEIAQDLTKMQVDTNVDEADVGHLQAGQPATFTVDAFPGRQFHGKVAQIRKEPINVQNVVTYDVVIAVANPDLKLYPGMTANVSVLVDRRDNVLRVPNAALRFRPPESKTERPAASPFGGGFGFFGGQQHGAQGGSTVYVLDPDGKPVAVPLKPGVSDGVYTEVAGGKLQPGQPVIVGLASAKEANAGGVFGGRR